MFLKSIFLVLAFFSLNSAFSVQKIKEDIPVFDRELQSKKLCFKSHQNIFDSKIDDQYIQLDYDSPTRVKLQECSFEEQKCEDFLNQKTYYRNNFQNMISIRRYKLISSLLLASGVGVVGASLSSAALLNASGALYSFLGHEIPKTRSVFLRNILLSSERNIGEGIFLLEKNYYESSFILGLLSAGIPLSWSNPLTYWRELALIHFLISPKEKTNENCDAVLRWDYELGLKSLQKILNQVESDYLDPEASKADYTEQDLEKLLNEILSKMKK